MKNAQGGSVIPLAHCLRVEISTLGEVAPNVAFPVFLRGPLNQLVGLDRQSAYLTVRHGLFAVFQRPNGIGFHLHLVHIFAQIPELGTV